MSKLRLWNISSKIITLERNSVLTFIAQSWNNAGFWSRSNGVHWMAKIAIICFATTLFTLYLGIFMTRDDIETLFESFSVGTFTSMAVFKLKSLSKNGPRWRFLLSQIEFLENKELNRDDEPVEYESDDDSKVTFSVYINSYTDRFEKISTLLCKIYYSTLIIHIFTPFIQYFIWSLQENVSGYPHMLPGWAPLDSVGIIGYMITILVELVACVYCVLVHVAFDLTVVGLAIFLCGQFLLLREYSETIGGSGNEYSLSKKRDDRAHFRIKECLRIHILLVNLIAELNDLIRNILGVYFFVATLTLCSVAYRLIAEEPTAMQVASLLQYMCAVLTQLFLFCYYGDAVMNESSVDMGRGPFGAASWCLSTGIRRELLLLSIAMSQPRKLRAGPFNSVDLPSFIQVIRTAYSYYAVLRK